MSKKLQYIYAVALPIGAIFELLLPQSTIAQTAPAQAPPAATAPAASEVQELVITARRREERVQSVPIAVTALSGAALKVRQLNGGQDLEQAVPNMSFTRSAFGASDYQIRGIGYQVVSTAADAGVGVDENNVPLVVNRLADADFYGADLSGTIFRDCDLSRADVAQAKLAGADVRGCRLDGLRGTPITMDRLTISPDQAALLITLFGVRVEW